MDTDSGNNVNRLSVIVMRPSRLSVYIYPGGSTQGMTRTQIRRPQDSPSCMMTGRVAYVHDLSSLPRWSYIDSPSRMFAGGPPFALQNMAVRQLRRGRQRSVRSLPDRHQLTQGQAQAPPRWWVLSLPSLSSSKSTDKSAYTHPVWAGSADDFAEPGYFASNLVRPRYTAHTQRHRMNPNSSNGAR